ncbi:peptidase inhibitor family I36 protein [Chengkuizengella sediminis]|uniref:peptidase inhibitor family I36 protein n=1 Tax=Chengkuizengella sediminis TaxID=1885917 RepID=UPI001389680D|nr:peptidase inhibitor family I36 protein [Chengkuizengella sediminis]NDI34638.1 beta/gamma crystallin family protein [Chengkuizengella sediminis]
MVVLFRKNMLSSFMICVMFFIFLLTMNVSAATEVNAQEREGYIMFDRGTYQVYYPEETIDIESNLKSPNLKSIDLKSTNLKSTNLDNNVESGNSNSVYVEPDLVIPALKANDPMPIDTYENRTSFRGIEPETYIPVNFIIDSKYFPNNDMMLSVLNDALNDKDPNVDTFIGVYDPVTESVTNYFPMQATNKITLLLNKHSYFAQNLTLDLEEWWARGANNYGNSDGVPISKTIERTFGVEDSRQNSVTITHGTGVDINTQNGGKVKVGIAEINWSVGFTFSYNYTNSNINSFTRTYHSSQKDVFTAHFGTKFPGTQYKWAVYDLVTRTKVNYSNADHFSELDDAFNNIDNYGLTPDMSSYMTEIKNSVYSVVEVPVYEVDPSLEMPQNLTAAQDFKNLTITLNWDAVSEDSVAEAGVDPKENNGKVAGYFVYKNGHLAGTIFDPTRTSWTDLNVEPGKANTYWLRSFSNNEYTITRYFYRQISPPSNTVSETVKLNGAQFKSMVIGCSIPFDWADDQIPAGERTYYAIYIGNPASGGKEVGKFEGKDASVNISPELYDLLKENSNQEFYIVKEVLYNNQLIQSSATKIPNHFTVTETAFLFSKAGFNGDCVTVSKDQSVNLSQTGYDFDNKLSSMLVQGNIWLVLFPQANYGGYSQAFFTDEGGYAHIRDFDEMIIGSNTVSSIKVREKWHGAYMFDGPDFSGSFDLYNDEQFARDSGGHQANDWMGYQRGDAYFKKDDSISSVKVVGPYAVALYENYNWSGAYALVKEDYGGPNLNSNIDNKASSISVFHGEGVWLFDVQTYRGNYKRFLPVDANTPYNCRHSSNECGFPGDTLSSVLVIGDYGVALYEHPDYIGRVQAVTNFDQYSGSSGDVGDNLMSSFRVFPKGVYLGQELNFRPGSSVIVKDPGNYSFVEKIGLTDNSLSSMFVVGNYKVTLYRDPVYKGESKVIYGWLGDFRSDPIGNDTVSSLKIEEY